MFKFYFILLFTPLLTQTISDYAYTHAEVAAMAGAVVAEAGSNWSIFQNLEMFHLLIIRELIQLKGKKIFMNFLLKIMI
mgnify:CR=1 FL=1